VGSAVFAAVLAALKSEQPTVVGAASGTGGGVTRPSARAKAEGS